MLPDDERKAFLRDRKGAIVGRKLAEQYGWKVGDQIPLRGTIYPGHLEFTLRGIYDGADAKHRRIAVVLPLGLPERDDQAQLHPRRADQVGVFIVGIDDPEQRGRRSRSAIDAHVQELARRDADRDREGVPARLRLDDRGDPGRDPGRVASSSSSSSWR